MLHGEHRSDCNAVFAGEPDLNLVPNTRNQVSEPVSRLWEQLMALPGGQQKPIELINKLLRSASFV
jgi:hypothetical protein